MIGRIYLITNNSSGDIYIGKTIQEVIARMIQHWRKAHNELNTGKSIPAFHKALLSVSTWRENFTVDILEDNIDVTDLSTRESYYIKKYAATNFSNYNMNFGEGYDKYGNKKAK